jgi:hypothetical protein
MFAGAPAWFGVKITLCGAPEIWKRTVPPTSSVTRKGLKSLPGVKTSASDTAPAAMVKVEEPVMPETVALTTVVPGEIALSRPLASTDAMRVSDERQAAVPGTTTPVALRASASSWMLCPTSSEVDDATTVTRLTGFSPGGVGSPPPPHATSRASDRRRPYSGRDDGREETDMRGSKRAIVKVWAGVAVRALTLAILAACDGPTEPRTPDGTYALQSVNGQTLPATIYGTAGSDYEVAAVSGRVDLRVGGQYDAVITVRETVDRFASTYVDSTAGTWREESPGIVALVTGTDTTRVRWQSRELTLEQDDGTGRLLTFRYARR